MPNDNAKVFVTKPHLPSLERLTKILRTSWDASQITNFGPLHTLLVDRLSQLAGTEYCVLFNNATTALMATLATLTEGQTGEVITTPFTFVATANSVVWSGNTPIFADIDPATGCLCPKSAEALITPATRAVVPVNCYGNSPDFKAFEEISASHKIPIIYDACHAFGIEDTVSVMQHGFASVVSFHATKVFNTFEGGAVFTKNKDLSKKLNRFLNFGIDATEQSMNVIYPGINGKMNEASAAMGLLQLEDFAESTQKRESIDAIYRKEFGNHAGIKCFADITHTKNNYAYFPIVLENSTERERVLKRLRQENIFARRYFYPLVTDLSFYRKRSQKPAPMLPNSEWLSDRVLCLPIFSDLSQEIAKEIVNIVAVTLSHGYKGN